MTTQREARHLSGNDLGKTIALPGNEPYGRIKSIEQNSGYTIINVHSQNGPWIPPLAVRRNNIVTITGTETPAGLNLHKPVTGQNE